MSDYISKEEAIDILEAYKQKLTDSVANNLDGDIEAFEIAINRLKTDVRENIHGEWIIDDTETIHGHCRKCGWESHYYEDDVVGMNFCPNCGSYNGGSENGNE